MLGVKIGQGPADSNKSVMCFYQTKRISTGPNVLCVMGCEFDADIAYAGIFFSVDNPYTDPALDYHKAPIIADDPLTVCFDGNRMVYTPGKLNYGTKGGVKLPANAACKVIANNNLLIPRTDPRAVQPFVINIDWAKIRGTELGDMIDGLGPDDYTDAKIQEIYDRVTTLRAGWTPPVVDAPTPPPTAEEDPVVIADLTAQVQQLTADNASLIAERDAANNAITAATAALQTAQDDLAEAIASRQAAEARAANAEGQAVTLTASLEAAMAAELKAVNDLATAVAAVRALNKLAAE